MYANINFSIKHNVAFYYQKGDIFAYELLGMKCIKKNDFMFRFEKFWIQAIKRPLRNDLLFYDFYLLP